MNFNYYYGSEADQFTFLRIPKTIISDPMFLELSMSAKLLYGVLLDRMGLSMKNKWLDSENRVYIIYKISEIMKDMNLTEKMAIKFLKELEDFGLIEKKRRGLGLPSLLYVKSFLVQEDHIVDKENENTEDTVEIAPEATINKRTVDLGSSRTVDLSSSRTDDLGSSRTDDLGSSRTVDLEGSRTSKRAVQEHTKKGALISKNNISDIKKNKNNINNQIISNHSQKNDTNRYDNQNMQEINAYENLIKENIEYDALVERYPHEIEMIDGIVDLMLETVVCTNDNIVIASSTYPKELVKSKLLKLNFSHIEYVLSCLEKNTTKVKNIKKYLLAMLFNAYSTMSSYYKSEVNYDFSSS